MNSLPPRPGKVILRAEEAEAWIDGYAFLDRARRQAADQERALGEARDAAYAEGFEAGRRAGETQAARLLATTRDDVDRYLARLEPALAELALDLVRRLLGEFDEAELVARCVRQALREWRQAHRIRIRVAPSLEAPVAALLSEEPPATGDYEVEADAQLGPGQCLLVSPVAVMDIGVDSQLDVLRQALLDAPADGQESA
ncbi:MAG: HrpE/YscL family type III secretion apparatus protein [Salinicola sp.]|uniref:type III secretion system stator protein SctL n=1 Tax=uncultured Salinicola sp. TaxID=1193542 RepID=UPI000C94679C|nr:type III secretion system stator protein SctL [uncultured Salinicola sp.]MAM59300.1 HrpE/YscL family type III secretion apparatus protein [Salinicola sp.]